MAGQSSAVDTIKANFKTAIDSLGITGLTVLTNRPVKDQAEPYCYMFCPSETDGIDNKDYWGNNTLITIRLFDRAYNDENINTWSNQIITKLTGTTFTLTGHKAIYINRDLLMIAPDPDADVWSSTIVMRILSQGNAR